MADRVGDRGSLEVFDSHQKGRGLRALKCFKAGEKTLESFPNVFVLSNTVRGQRCDFCFSASETLLRCSKCKFARYCGRGCQKKAWKSHKNECNRTAKIHPNAPTDMVRLIARILDVKQQAGGESDMVLEIESLLDSLVSNTDKMSGSRKEVFVTVLAALKLFVGENDIPDTSELFEVFGKISCNSFTICDAEMQSVGVGLFAKAALLNHSCHPNCVATFHGTTLQITATETIQPGDELTISYTELLRPSYKRKEDLWEQYGFDCQCRNCVCCDENDAMMNAIRCQRWGCQGKVPVGTAAGYFRGSCQSCNSALSDDKVGKNAKSLIIQVEEVLQEIKKLQKSGESSQILELCEQTLQEQSSIFCDLNYLVVQILDCAMDSCIALQLWEKALAYGLRTLEAYRRFYPKYHPSTGIQLFRIGKLRVHLDSLQEGVTSLEQAAEILRITHGLTHPLVSELNQLLYETCEELRLREWSVN